jgi:hypothetical protein
MEDPEAYLHAMAARLAWAQEGSPLPVTRFSVEAVANAFVMLGLLPAARAGEILAAQRPVLGAADFRVGLEIGELSVTSDARAFQEARATGATRVAAKAIGVGVSTLQRWAARGVVAPALRTPGGQARWDIEDLKAQLRVPGSPLRGEAGEQPGAPD